MKVAESVPVALRATVRLLALISPGLKLIVEVVGFAIGSGPRYTAQEKLEFTTVTLPVTALALPGTPPRPATAKVAGVLARIFPERPLLTRVSRSRAGAVGWYVSPFVSPTVVK